MTHESAWPRIPRPGEVHVWRFALNSSGSELDRLGAALSTDEWERSDRLRRDELRARFITGRGRLREILAAYLRVEPRSLGFDYGPQGKPALTTGGLEFNLSHSSDQAILGVTLGAPLGVDVESIDPGRDVLGILDRFFAEKERAEFLDTPGDDRLRAFYRGWSRKEAFLKALGTGLSTPLDAFEVSLDRNRAEIVRVGDDPFEASRWSLRDVDAGPGYAAAIVVRGTIARVITRDWPAPSETQVPGSDEFGDVSGPSTPWPT